MLLDSGILIAYYNRRDEWHQAAARLLDAKEILLLPAPVIPEVDYLLGKRMGLAAQMALYEDIGSQVYQVVDLSEAGYQRVFELYQQYQSLRLGFVDAAVIAIAEELGIGQIATLDRRHFGAVEARIKLELLP
ncbi:MAG: ribonuclease VapC [Meiothermus sp.]|uniref:type II toxin-antitoxin system VapC family toxin n=1 Tax=Meiothermus sp. TaxID=1955249 RepID=UPI0021DF3C2F|nr:PIN domain-containing protein [Meiothermus sp.]GIW29365.1 MAG: ribonuclease VapC [Meiothermus sp.]